MGIRMEIINGDRNEEYKILSESDLLTSLNVAHITITEYLLFHHKNITMTFVM